MGVPSDEQLQEHSHLHEQIELIARHEQDFQHRRTRSERLGDALGRAIGSLWFVGIHAAWISLWILVNVYPAFHHFDPVPFPLLDSIVALEAIFLASFIVMRQGRMNRRADERDHLILQILILTEREITAILRLQKELALALGMKKVAEDETIHQMSQDTQIDEITLQVQKELSES